MSTLHDKTGLTVDQATKAVPAMVEALRTADAMIDNLMTWVRPDIAPRTAVGARDVQAKIRAAIAKVKP